MKRNRFESSADTDAQTKQNQIEWFVDIFASLKSFTHIFQLPLTWSSDSAECTLIFFYTHTHIGGKASQRTSAFFSLNTQTQEEFSLLIFLLYFFVNNFTKYLVMRLVAWWMCTCICVCSFYCQMYSVRFSSLPICNFNPSLNKINITQAEKKSHSRVRATEKKRNTFHWKASGGREASRRLVNQMNIINDGVIPMGFVTSTLLTQSSASDVFAKPF